MKKSVGKPYLEGNTEELREAARAYDSGESRFPGKPMAATDRRILTAARRRGRSQIDRGVKTIYVLLERGLLRQADTTAKRLRLTRSQLIARCLREGLKRAG